MREVFKKAYGKVTLINACSLRIDTNCSAKFTGSPRALVPWLLLTKDPEEYINSACYPEGFLIRNPSKLTKSNVDKLWRYWEQREKEDEVVLRFISAKPDDMLPPPPKSQSAECASYSMSRLMGAIPRTMEMMATMRITTATAGTTKMKRMTRAAALAATMKTTMKLTVVPGALVVGLPQPTTSPGLRADSCSSRNPIRLRSPGLRKATMDLRVAVPFGLSQSLSRPSQSLSSPQVQRLIKTIVARSFVLSPLIHDILHYWRRCTSFHLSYELLALTCYNSLTQITGNVCSHTTIASEMGQLDLAAEISSRGHSSVVEFKSPVASGFLTCFGSNWTATGLSNITLCADRTETCGNRLPSVAMAITTGRDQFFTRPVLMLTMLHVL